MPTYYMVLIVANTFILVSGQFLWKMGLERDGGAFQSLPATARLMMSPYIVGGLVLYGAATVLWLYVLARVDLSLAYPVQSLAYLVAVVGAYFVFQEPLSPAKVGGCVLILSGVTLIGLRG